MASLTDYKGLDVLDAATGAGGAAINDDFKELADRAGPVHAAASDPSVNDDSSGTAGNGKFYIWSKWRNTSNNKIFVCVDPSTGAAVWVDVTAATVDVYEDGSSVVSAVARLDFKDLQVENPSDAIAAIYLDLPRVCDLRLSLTSGTPITISDVTAASTIYWTPYRGAKVALFDGTRWKVFATSELSLAVPASVFRLFDIFVYDNSGTLTLETANWDSSQNTGSITGATNATPIVITSNSHGLSDGDLVGIDGIVGNTAPNTRIWTVVNTTTNTFTLAGSVGNGTYTSGGTWYQVPASRSNALVRQDGVLVKAGASTRRYLGTAMTTSTSGETEDSRLRRFLFNAEHQIQRPLIQIDTTNSWTYNTATYRPANNNIDNRVQVVVGVDGSMVQLTVWHMGKNTLGGQLNASFSQDSITTADDIIGQMLPPGVANMIRTVTAHGSRYPGAGYHFFCWLESGNASGTSTFYGDGGVGSATVQSGISGWLEG